MSHSLYMSFSKQNIFLKNASIVIRSWSRIFNFSCTTENLAIPALNYPKKIKKSTHM